MTLEKGDWLESNNGAKWEIIKVRKDELIIRKYYKDSTVGTITGITLKDVKKYFKSNQKMESE